MEISNIDAFVDALNAAPMELKDGDSFNYIGVGFCSQSNAAAQIQNLTARGTVMIQGVDYATHPTSGLVAGTTAQDVNLPIKGGCGSFCPLMENVTASADTPIKVKLFFDPSFSI